MNDVMHKSEQPTLPFAQLTLDAKRVVRAHCRRFEEWFPGNSIGLPFDRFIPRSDRAGQAKYLSRVASYRSGYLDVFVVLALHSQERLCRVRMRQEPSKEWHVIVEALEADDPIRRLLKSRENQIAVMRSSLIGMAFLNEDRQIQDYNEKFFEICNFQSKHGVALSEASLIGRTIQQISGAELEPLHEALDRENPRQRIFNAQVRVQTRTLHFSLTPIFLALNLVGGYVMTVEDLTDAEELTRLRLENARCMGQAEIATSMLHNVGNVLNSLTVSREMLSRYNHVESIEFLEQVIDLLDGKDPADFLSTDQGEKLLPCLRAISSKLSKNHQRRTEELAQMGNQIGHIQAIISKQQQYAQRMEIIEHCTPEEIFEDALAIAIPTPLRADIDVVKNFSSSHSLMLDRHRVTEILVNLLKNAFEAIGPEQASRKIEISTHGDGDDLVFSVKDSGAGISAEQQTQLFQHGFTTKEDGHGFGLHSCGCIAMEMNAELTGFSEGLGKGSLFQLSVPVRPC